MLNNLLNVVPELNEFANMHLKIAFNKDSSRVGPAEWQTWTMLLHHNRKHYDALTAQHALSPDPLPALICTDKPGMCR